MALAEFYRGKFGSVLRAGGQLLERAHQLADPQLRFSAHNVLGWGYMGAGRVREALDEYRAALIAAEEASDKVRIAIATANLGVESFLGGRFGEVRDYLVRTVTLYDETAGELRTVNAHQHLGRLCLFEGDFAAAGEYAERALQLAERGHERWAAD